MLKFYMTVYEKSGRRVDLYEACVGPDQPKPRSPREYWVHVDGCDMTLHDSYQEAGYYSDHDDPSDAIFMVREIIDE